MSAEIEIIGNCVCGQKLDLEIDFVDGEIVEIVLSVGPCKQCVEKALQGLVHNSLYSLFESPKWLTPQLLDELKKTKILLTVTSEGKETQKKT